MALPQPTGNVDGSATLAGSEGASYSIPAGRTASVWYGAASVRYVRLDAVSGTVTFNNSTFGDVAPFTAKNGYYLLDPDSSGGSLSMSISTDSFGDATYVGEENASYAGGGSTYSAWYGKSKEALARLDNRTGTITFNNATFGDPVFGAKYGWRLTGAYTEITTPHEIDVTAEGTDTWAIFSSGTSGAASNRKASSSSADKISDIGTNISGTQSTYITSTTFGGTYEANYTDGTSPGSGSTSGATGNDFNQVDGRDWKLGDAINFLADTTERTAVLYVLARDKVRVSAVLGDGSAPAVVQTYETNNQATGASVGGIYFFSLIRVELVYKAANAAQVLRVQVTPDQNGDFDNRNVIYFPAATLAESGSDTSLAGAANIIAAATGQLSTSIKLISAAVALAAATGSLSTQVRLNAAALDVASATGQLTTQVKLGGAASDTATATGNLTTAIKLAGSAANVANANGALSTQIKLAGNAVAQALATASFDSAVLLSAAAQNNVVATATLTTQIKFTGNAEAVSTAAASLAGSATSFSGNAASLATAAAALSTQIKFSAGAQSVVTLTADITIEKPLTGAMLSQALATGELQTSILLGGFAVNRVTVFGDLTTVVLNMPGARRNGSIDRFSRRPRYIQPNRRH